MKGVDFVECVGLFGGFSGDSGQWSTKALPEFVVGNTELGGGKLKRGKGFSKPNFELVPN
jgi:hypothetical protein